MPRVTKKPEVRKQELVDVALALFLEKGYEAVSVRDILKEVNGAPGMFYYYFESKQEIYIEAIEQFVSEAVEERKKILHNKEHSIMKRFENLLNAFKIDIKRWMRSLTSPENSAYAMVIVMQLVDGLAKPVAEIIIEAIENGIIPETSVVNKDNAYQAAIFLINGVRGLFSENNDEMEIDNNIATLASFVLHFLGVPKDKD